MRTIKQYSINSNGVKIPENAKILHCGCGADDSIYLWAEIDASDSARSHTVKARIMVTGEQFDDPRLKHCTTFLRNKEAWHVYLKRTRTPQRTNNLMAYEIDLTNITQDLLQAAISGYNSEYNASYALSADGSNLVLTNGEDPTQDVIASGSLREVAYYWEGFISGQLHGIQDQDDDNNI